jgi:hypothetical protein
MARAWQKCRRWQLAPVQVARRGGGEGGGVSAWACHTVEGEEEKEGRLKGGCGRDGRRLLKQRRGEVGEGGCWLGRATRRREDERKRGRGQQLDHGVRMALGGAVRGGSMLSGQRRAGEHGRAAGRGRRGMADRWGRAAMRPVGQRRGAGEREESEAVRWRGIDRRARPAQCRATQFEWIQRYSLIQTDSKTSKF